MALGVSVVPRSQTQWKYRINDVKRRRQRRAPSPAYGIISEGKQVECASCAVVTIFAFTNTRASYLARQKLAKAWQSFQKPITYRLFHDGTLQPGRKSTPVVAFPLSVRCGQKVVAEPSRRRDFRSHFFSTSGDCPKHSILFLAGRAFKRGGAKE